MALINFVNRVWFEQNAIGRVPAELTRLKVNRPLICTDKGIAAAGLLDRLREIWPGSLDWIVYDETPSNPTEQAVLAALALFTAERCDGIVAMGGGSPIDLGKAVNLLVSNEGPLATYEAALKGQSKIAPVGPLIAIPTTAGTGTEVSVGTIIVTSDTRKATIASSYLIPTVAICDPQLTLGLPRGLTAATGMDAVTHCVEAVLSPLFNPVADAIGLDGLSRAIAGGALVRAVADGSDIAARSDMMMAALEGALAFTKGLGAVHAMSHAAGRIAELRLHHGTLNAVILPAVLRFNAPHAGVKLDRVAQAMGLSGGAALPSAIEELNLSIGLPASLGALNITAGMVPEMIRHATEDVSGLTNPVRPTARDYERMFLELL